MAEDKENGIVSSDNQGDAGQKKRRYNRYKKHRRPSSENVSAQSEGTVTDSAENAPEDPEKNGRAGNEKKVLSDPSDTGDGSSEAKSGDGAPENPSGGAEKKKRSRHRRRRRSSGHGDTREDTNAGGNFSDDPDEELDPDSEEIDEVSPVQSPELLSEPVGAEKKSPKHKEQKNRSGGSAPERKPQDTKADNAAPADEALHTAGDTRDPVPVEEPFVTKEGPEVEKTEVIGIRFRSNGKIYYFSPGGFVTKAGDHVIVETVRGVEIGEVAIPNREVPITEIVSPLKSVLRIADDNDLRHHEENREAEKKAREIFCEKAALHNLAMTLVDVEYTFDNTKLLFYFTSDGRVDFRELVKELASIYKTRIELRQIGVRDEAKQIGGLGICGRPFCCKTFLSDFQQVSIKMAKDQNLSLNSTKISGTCGRLMCCLRYENDVYEEEARRTPRVDSVVDTPQGRGTVVESNVLSGKIKVVLEKNPEASPETFHRSEVRIVSERKKEEKIPDELKALEEN